MTRDVLAVHSTGTKIAPFILRLLRKIGVHVPLSHRYVGFRSSDNLMYTSEQNLSCKGEGVFYDPSLCLDDEGWGGTVFRISIVRGKAEVIRLSRSRRSAPMGEAVYQEPGMADYGLHSLLSPIGMLWTQQPEFSPDLFFVHPAAENCRVVQQLLMLGPVNPKVIILPYNPLIPPPYEVAPYWPEFWTRNKPFLETDESGAWVEGSGPYLHSMFFKAQCSLAAIQQIFEGVLLRKKRKFVFYSLGEGYVTYIRHDLQKYLIASSKNALLHSASGAGAAAGKKDDGILLPLPHRDYHLWRFWLNAWVCNSNARFWGNLELTMHFNMHALADPEVSDYTKGQILCDYLKFHVIPIFTLGIHGGKPLICEDFWQFFHQGKRGWGGQSLRERYAPTPGACERICFSNKECRVWTFDPLGFYGRRLCWVWETLGPATDTPQGRNDVRQGRFAGEFDVTFKNEPTWVSGYNPKNVAPETWARLIGQDSYPPSTTDINEKTSKTGTTNSTDDALVYELVPQSTRDVVIAQKIPELPPSLPGMTDSLIKIYSFQEIPETIGLRYLLEREETGRCVWGLCECYPPRRGLQCEMVHAARTVELEHKRLGREARREILEDGEDDEIQGVREDPEDRLLFEQALQRTAILLFFESLPNFVQSSGQSGRGI